MKILGIDPGTTNVGYGLIEKESNKYALLKAGLLDIKTKTEPERLLEIEKTLKKLLKETEPEKVGIEKIFFSKNKKTAIAVAQARGVVLTTLAKEKLDIFEISPSQVKSSITGNGNASKESVAKMVKHFIKEDTNNLSDDAVDAIAIAITVSNLNKEIYDNS